MAKSMSQARKDIIDEMDTIKTVGYRLEAYCDNIGMELLSEKLSEVIKELESARQRMKSAEF